jgi:competence protein ComGC
MNPSHQLPFEGFDAHSTRSKNCHRAAIFPCRPQHAKRAGFTVVEALIALTVLTIFFVVSTMALNLFDTRAAQNRNTEAARAIVDDYVSYLLDDNTAAPAVTAAGTSVDGDGIPDGVVCTALDSKRAVPNPLPLIESRTATPAAVVSGTLYWRVQAVGKSFSLNADTDLLQINFTLDYTFRGQHYYYKAMTYKGR